MANWITLKQLSEKRGIAESDLRTWANLGYIASSRIENVLMIDDESLTQYLDVHQTKDLGENYLERNWNVKYSSHNVTTNYFY